MTENELFLKRSDELAYKLRLSLRELAPKLGLSAGSFFGYRTGRVPLSAKAWRKLEDVERSVAMSDHSAESPAVVCEEPADYGRSIVDITKRLQRMEAMLARLLAAKDLDDPE